MGRPDFNLGAYGKPRPRSAQAFESRVQAYVPITADLKDLKASEPRITDGNTLNTCNESAKADPTPDFNIIHDVDASAAPLPNCWKPDIELSIPNPPRTELVDSLTTNVSSPATLPQSKISFTLARSVSITSEATRVVSPRRYPNKSTVSVLESSAVQKTPSAAKSDKPNSNASINPFSIEKSSQSQAHLTDLLEAENPQLNTDVANMSAKGKSTQAATKSDRLKQLQDDSLHQISRKAAVAKIKPTNASVSIRDLDLARKPVDPENPQGSFRRWAQDSPLYVGGYGDGIASFSSIEKELSVLPQVSSTRAPHVHRLSITSPTINDARNAKWALKDEMKAEKAEAGSNDWGSDIPSDATRASNVSDESFGKLLRRQDAAKDEPLYDWQGRMMPPPADWAERPRYNNNNSDFKAQFKDFVGEAYGRYSNGTSSQPLKELMLRDPNNIPDGIGMVLRHHTINVSNAEGYGYPLKNNPELYESISKYAQPIKDNEFDLITKVDSSDQGNQNHDSEETTNSLVTNWNKHLANARSESLETGRAVPKHIISKGGGEAGPTNAPPTADTSSAESSKTGDDDGTTPLMLPKLNVYLRPATEADLRELTRIYNWHVVNGSQPSELREIDEAAMKGRMQFCTEGKLPFIVAGLKSQKNAVRIPAANNEDLSRRRQLPVTHGQPPTLTRIEQLAGFCCANDFSQPDYLEYIATDIEVYVDAQYRRMGVGRSLMDKMLHICDRGHRLTMNVPFHCDQEIRHQYEAGGNRDLHKLIITLRKWHTPKPVAINVNMKRKSRKLPLTKTEENSYSLWMRTWLESLGFEEEGYLKKMGAKNGRYIDIVFLGRATCWEPEEGKVPAPAQEFLNAYEYDENDEDGW